jgi:tRNA (cmo5U34)-methyltransferase
MKALNRFNQIASVYDILTRMVFGKSIRNAQVRFLDCIPPHGNVLVLGGGTGWLLHALLSINPSCRVWYIEASSSMIEKTRRKIGQAQQGRVHFIHGTENAIPRGMRYDAVITYFFLDLFTAPSLDDVIGKVQAHLKPRAVWLASDFVDREKWWQKALLRMMYLFFRLTCSLETKQLPPWEARLTFHELEEVETEYFFGSFIKSVMLRNRMAQ